MNLNKKHFFYASSYELSQLIAPLKKYHITYFAYKKSYQDGARIYLGTHPEMFEKYISMKYYLQGNVESSPNSYTHQQFVLWSTLQNQECYKFARLFDIDHGMYLIYPDKSGSSCEFLSFGSTSQHPEVVNFYLNNPDTLQAFVSNFRENAKNIILQAEKNKIILPFNQQNINCYKINDIEINKNSEITTRIKFTSREYDCINMLISGYTIKEIAKDLKLSPRTVEDYILSLRHKFQAKNKVELIIKLLKYINKPFL